MKTIYFRDFVIRLWSRKKQVIALVIVFSVIFGYIGYTKANKTASEEQLKEIEEYEAAIKEYDNLILELEDSIEIAQEQVDNQEKYCDNSIYLKLDAQNIQVAELQYAIQTTNNVGFILNSFVILSPNERLAFIPSELSSNTKASVPVVTVNSCFSSLPKLVIK